jgi:CheY-like chemotaxis protein
MDMKILQSFGARVSHGAVMMSNILLVDDNDNHSALVEQELSDEGYSVVIAKSGTEALNYVLRNRPDLMLTDVAMPRYAGIELIQDILRHDPTIPVIIYSGYAAYRNTFMAHGADAFVLKSGDLSELKFTIVRLLSAQSKAYVGCD